MTSAPYTYIFLFFLSTTLCIRDQSKDRIDFLHQFSPHPHLCNSFASLGGYFQQCLRSWSSVTCSSHTTSVPETVHRLSQERPRPEQPSQERPRLERSGQEKKRRSQESDSGWKRILWILFTKPFHILHDFLFLLRQIFHLFHRRQVHNYMERTVIKSRVRAWVIG
jgi:hypothetical protein